jgi:PPM family protein phosphatase
MTRIIAAGVTDTGQVRPANEDAYLVGESVFAVADGMGGHLAGEVASATALEPIEELDGKVFPDATEAVSALREAVVAANDRVSRMAADEPSYRGMGTTLTATMIEGRRVHIAHVGDSRAYLLRNGHFSQLTDDHTLVQHLVDEGQITREEAATHPQRSIITRAIGVSREVDVDSMSLDLEPGDQLLLCSDGLTGVVEDEVIESELTPDVEPQEALDRLVERANAAGGPDNITIVILKVTADEADGAVAAADGNAAGNGAGHGDGPGESDSQPYRVVTRDDREGGDWADRLGNYGSLGKASPWSAGSDEETERDGGGLLRAGAVLLGILVLGGLLIGGGWLLLSQSYFVGLEDDAVVIYQGMDAEVGPLELARIVERTELTADEVPTWYRRSLEHGVAAADLNDARRIVANAPRRDDPEDPTEATAADDADDADDEDGADPDEDDPDEDETS